MIKTHEEPIPASVRKVMTVVCDACGAEQADSQWPAKATWGRDDAEAEVQVRSVVREIGYECDGSIVGLEWDFCPACFENKVRPLLESVAAPRKVNESW